MAWLSITLLNPTVAKFKYLATKALNGNLIHGEI
jgi:hypothetical protein